MKRFLLLCGVAALSLAACKKDNNPSDGIDRNCGVILEFEKQADGGVDEHIADPNYYGCTDKFREMAAKIKNGPTTTNWHVFYKGEKRPAAKYLVILDKRSSKPVFYIRYESGSVPDTTLAKWDNENYKPQVKTLTGLERFTY